MRSLKLWEKRFESLDELDIKVDTSNFVSTLFIIYLRKDIPLMKKVCLLPYR